MLARALQTRFRQWRLRRHPIPAPIWRQALAYSRYAGALARSERKRLRELTTLFLQQKRFEGAVDFAPDDTARAVIGLKACIPILHLGLEYYRGWHGIVVYPGDFRVQEEYMDEAGVVHRAARDLCGESLTQGPLVLSWATIDAERDTDDRDLVIHECAHKLDMLNGPADGFPPLPAHMSPTHWTDTFAAAYDNLNRDIDAGREPRLDPYAGTDPAEFFSVASETFFTAPAIVHEEYPAVYDALREFYRQDPLALLGATP